jgi:hypothetical protein
MKIKIDECFRAVAREGEMNQIVVYRPTKEEALAAIQNLLRREAWAKDHPGEVAPGELKPDEEVKISGNLQDLGN